MGVGVSLPIEKGFARGKDAMTDFEISEVLVCLFGNGNVFVRICEGCRRFVPHRRIVWHVKLYSLIR